MSAAYAIGGAMIGAMIARIGPEQTAWALMVVPAGLCFAIAWTMENRRGS